MVDYSKYYTEQGLRDLILIQALDTASFNTDRHMQNYYAQVNDPYGDLKAQHFISFDYGASAGSSEKYLEHINFFNTFGTTCMNFDKDASLKTREEMISCFRENETIGPSSRCNIHKSQFFGRCYPAIICARFYRFTRRGR